MRIALDWLQEMVPVEGDAGRVAEMLTMGGIEVEDQVPAAQFTGVVVGRVASVERHPNADRLSVCTVDTGADALRTIVCGAPNVVAGMLAPCALPGALLPGDFAIKISTVRGVRSEGMLCSARELGLSDDAQGLLVLDGAAVLGTDLRAALGLDSPIFEIKATPNRGDCLSALGIARELAALSGTPLRAAHWQAVPVTSEERLPVRIDSNGLCGRFSGRVIRGLDAARPTPDWMKRRLEQCGQRPIAALVDISNFVMLELGQPSHVFDLQKVRGGLCIRWARAGERIALLNDTTVTLDANNGVVADDAGPEAIAGIMGGSASAVSTATTDVYLEAAFWWPEAIQGRARQFNFSTEAAYRFERGVDFAGTRTALERLAQLIVQICGTGHTQVGPIDDTVQKLPAREPVRMRLAHLQRVLGIAIPEAEAQACFDRLQMKSRSAAGVFEVVPPSYRFDLQREIDLIEEVARVYGYERIPADPPMARARMRARPEATRSAHDVRRQMARAGFQELVNFSFVPESWETDLAAEAAPPIRVLNPIASQHAVMRSNLLTGLAANLRYNLNRQATRVRGFEVGRVFARDANVVDGPDTVAGVHQPFHLAALAYGPAEEEQWGVASRTVDFFDLKGELEQILRPHAVHFTRAADSPAHAGFPDLRAALHPGRSAAVILGASAIGYLGELHPRVCKNFELPGAPVVFEVLLDPLLNIGVPEPGEIARFPALVRDIAVWVDDAVPAGDVVDDLRALTGTRPELAAVRSVRLFDVFRGSPQGVEKGGETTSTRLLNKEKSLAFRIVLQDTQRSLAEADADAVRTAIIEHLMQRWRARGRE